MKLRIENLTTHMQFSPQNSHFKPLPAGAIPFICKMHSSFVGLQCDQEKHS